MASPLESDLFIELESLSPYIVSPNVSLHDAIRTPPPEPTTNYLSLFTVFGESPEQAESDICMLIGVYEQISDPIAKGRILRALFHLHYHYAKLLEHTPYGKSPQLLRCIRIHEDSYPKAAFFYCEDLCQSALDYGLTLSEFEQLFTPDIVQRFRSLQDDATLDVVDLCSPDSIEVVSQELPAEDLLCVPQLPTSSPSYTLCPHQFRGWLTKASCPITCANFEESLTLVNAAMVTDYIESMLLVGPSCDQIVSYVYKWGILYLTTGSHIYLLAPSNHRLCQLNLFDVLLHRGEVIVYVTRTARSTCVGSVT